MQTHRHLKHVTLCLILLPLAAKAAEAPRGGDERWEPSPSRAGYRQLRNARGEIVAVAAPDGATDEFRFDERGRVQEIVRADGRMETFVYAENGDVTAARRGGSATVLASTPGGVPLAEARCADAVCARSLLRDLRDRYAVEAWRDLPEVEVEAGRVALVERNELVTIRRHGDASGALAEEQLETSRLTFTARSAKSDERTLHITDSQGGYAVATYRPGTSDTDGIIWNGRPVLAREFDSTGRVSSETFSSRYRIDYSYSGGGGMWTTKTVKSLPDGGTLFVLVASEPRGTVFSTDGLQPTADAMRRGANRAPFPRVDVRRPALKGHAGSFSVSGGIEWYAWILDGRYATLDAEGYVRSRVIATRSLRTSLANDEVEIGGMTIRLILDAPGVGPRVVLEAPLSTVPEPITSKRGPAPLLAIGDCEYTCWQVCANNYCWTTECNSTPDFCYSGGGAGSGEPGEPGGSGGPGGGIQVSGFSPDMARTVRLQLNQAKTHVESAPCQALFQAFSQNGRAILNSSHYSPNQASDTHCNGSNAAYTNVGSTEVTICTDRFNTTLSGWITLIHEALHSAGQNELGPGAACPNPAPPSGLSCDPPTSNDLNNLVRNACL